MFKKITFIFAIVFSLQFNYSQEVNPVLKNARELSEKKEYKDAIKQYISYVKDFKGELKDLKEVYYEIANCYYFTNDSKMAVKVMRESISKLGVTKEELAGAMTLDEKLFEITWANINKDYNSLRKEYIKKVKNIDEYVEGTTSN